MPRVGPLRIVHALAPGAVGGIESVVRLLALGQQEAGHTVDTVTVVDHQDHPFTELLRESGLRAHSIVAPDRAYRKEVQAFRACLSEMRPDIVHTHGTRPDVLLSRAARKFGCATVTTVHGFSGGDLKNRLYEFLQRRAMASMSAVAAVSAAQESILIRSGVSKQRLQIVPNAWRPLGEPLDRASARHALGLPASGKMIGYVGRLSFEKGPDILLDALGQMRDDDWRASFLGDGAEAGSLRTQAQTLGLADRVSWHGSLPDAWRLFRAFDVLAMPSRTEGTPISLFEAMYARIPLVLTRVGGVPAVIEPDPNSPPLGQLVPPLDPAALAAGLRTALAGGEVIDEQITRASKRLEVEYAIEPWLERYAALYQAALASQH